MADGQKRIIDQPVDTELSPGDYVMVDSQSGEGTRQFDLGTVLRDIKADLQELQEEIEGGGSGLTADLKAALDQLAQKVAYIDEDGQDYYDALHAALYPPANLTRISCVYTQSGPVYDTASLDSLKPDLVVTGYYSNGTTQIITTYTLSGTLAEGTSTITVAYGGKTTTFNVTVTTFSTAIRIAEYDKTLNGSGNVVSTPGACYSEGYDYQIDVNALKNSSHYDSTNNYMNTSSCIFKVKYVTTNPSSISYGSGGKLVCFDTSDVKIDYASVVRTGALSQWNDSRYTSGYLTLADNTIRLKFSLDSAALDDSYAYFDDTLDHIMPVGVSVGDVIFAGANTPYYGKHNIND